MRVALLLVTVAILMACLPGSGMSDAGSASFQARFDLPRDPDALLKEILARKEFRSSPIREAFERLIDRVKAFLVDFLRRLWKSMPRLGPIDAAYDPIWIFLGTVLAASGITLLVVLGKRLIEFLLGKYGALARVQHPESEAARVDGSREILNQALKAAETGEYATALVLLFRHALVWLDETGRLSLQPGKTNREILESIPADEPMRQGLSEMIPVFNRVRYGQASCGRTDYEHFLAACRLVTGGSGVYGA